MGTNVLSNARHFHCTCHATWLPCKTSIEHKPSTKFWGVHVDEMLSWDDQIKHISFKVSNGLLMLYLAGKLTDNHVYNL